MKYINAESVLPKQLILEIQKYVSGNLIYIPTLDNIRYTWGEKNGCRKALDERNSKIFYLYQSGRNVKEIADEFYLSTKSIYRIIAGIKNTYI